MLKQSILAATTIIGLGLALPFAVTSSAQAAAAGACVAAPCGVPPPPPPPGGGNPGGNPNPNGPGGSTVVDEGADFDHHQTKLLIACRVPKDGGAETMELRFRNIGDATIPGGTRVSWNANGQGGQFFLPTDLAVGKELTKDDLLKLGVPADAGCLSKLEVPAAAV